jgi:putative ABC transport system substrate-binding protein
MQRRDVLTLLGGAAVAWPFVARAQQPALSVVGFLHSGPASSNAHLVDAFRRGLAEASYDEGRNVMIEYRWAEGHYERLAELAAELVRRPVAVIVGGAPPAARAAKAATTTIPVVFVSGDDPITSGLVDKLNRPDGNITGVSVFSGSQLGEKHVELLHALLPTAATIALLVNPTNATQTEAQTQQTAAAAHRVGLRLQVMHASTESDVSQAFAMFAEQRVDALIVGGDPFFTSQRNRLVALAARHALPVVYNLREFVAAGGLMSYGSSITDAYRQAGLYTVRILQGIKPSDLPVMRPMRFELIINLKTAQELGLSIPPLLLYQADEVMR